MVCPNCGSQEFNILADGSGCCRYCGYIIPGMGRPAPNQFEQQINNIGTNFQTGKKDKIIALLLTFFFGWCGGQYFYLGKTSLGVICLLFCWTGIPYIWSYVYFIILLTMGEQQFNAKFNTRTR